MRFLLVLFNPTLGQCNDARDVRSGLFADAVSRPDAREAVVLLNGYRKNAPAIH